MDHIDNKLIDPVIEPSSEKAHCVARILIGAVPILGGAGVEIFMAMNTLGLAISTASIPSRKHVASTAMATRSPVSISTARPGPSMRALFIRKIVDELGEPTWTTAISANSE